LVAYSGAPGGRQAIGRSGEPRGVVSPPDADDVVFGVFAMLRQMASARLLWVSPLIESTQGPRTGPRCTRANSSMRCMIREILARSAMNEPALLGLGNKASGTENPGDRSLERRFERLAFLIRRRAVAFDAEHPRVPLPSCSRARRWL
jgi:hypothetical protein